MWNSIADMQKDVLALIGNALRTHAFFSIATRLQKSDIDCLLGYYSRLEDTRKAAATRLDEPMANMAFILACYVKATLHFIWMWLFLKKNKMKTAWDSLVMAQDHLSFALRLHEFDGMSSFNTRLGVAEKLLFPPQVYSSSAPVFGWTQCSICGERYGEDKCCHLAGELYMGQMCVKKMQDFQTFDHIAIVEEPDDKRLHFPSDDSAFTGQAGTQNKRGKGRKRRPYNRPSG